MNECEALLILNAIPGIGNARIRKLIEHYGCAKNVLSLNEKDLKAESGLPREVFLKFFNFRKDEFLRQETELLRQRQVEIVTIHDDDYPEHLRQICDAPIILYAKGKIPSQNQLSIAIVGSRKASVYGMTTAEQFASRLAEYGFVVVSGMARGIDTAAHRGALRSRGVTLAVLGSGLNNIYPPENRKLFENISSSGGCVLSEFPMTMKPLAHNFPRRNRIISGLSLGVVVVEATARSGALITADFALEQGREVFAIPGRIDTPSSQGVHHLIKQGAKLVMGVEDIIEELNIQISQWLSMKSMEKPQRLSNDAFASSPELSPKEELLHSRLGKELVHIDELCQKSGMSARSAAFVLLQLEMKHLIKKYPGQFYTLN